MNKLANNGFGKARAKQELIIGANEEIIQAVFDYYSQRGRNVVIVDQDDYLCETCDVVMYIVDWERTSIYLSPFKETGVCPNVIIERNYLPLENILDQVIGFLEAIDF